MIEIPLTQGQTTIIDDIDGDLATNYKWTAHYNKKRGTYVAERSFGPRKERKKITIHREILSRVLGRVLDVKEDVDHINTNTLDNRRENLRLATRTQNSYNRDKNKNNTSGYKGVTYHKQIKKWVAQIWIEGCRRHLGVFVGIEDAAEAYKQAAIKYHGEFARYTGMDDE